MTRQHVVEASTTTIHSTSLDPPYMSPQPYSITREEAAERLKVSIRTLDRYIRRGYFDVKRVNRSVWISQPSLERYCEVGEAAEKNTTESTQDSSTNSTNEIREVVSTPESVSEELSEDFHEEILPKERLNLSSHEHPHDMTAGNIYKSLYRDLKGKYEEQLKRLEGAHYRVGQLEAQIKTMVPMLEYKKQRKQFLLMDKQYKEALTTTKKELNKSKRECDNERFNKNIYIAIVYGLLAFQPLLWILIANGR